MTRNSSVSDKLLAYCQKDNTDILLLHEPYTLYNKLVGLETSPYRVIMHRGPSSLGRHSITTWTAIVVLNLELQVIALQHLTSIHFAVASVGFPNGKQIVFILAYFQHRHPTIIYTQKLEEIINKIGTNHSIQTFVEC